MATGHDGSRDTRVWPGATRDQDRLQPRARDSEDARRGADQRGREAARPAPEEWVEEEAVRGEAAQAVLRGGRKGTRRQPARAAGAPPARERRAPRRVAETGGAQAPSEARGRSTTRGGSAKHGQVDEELLRAVGARRATRASTVLHEASRSFRRERFREAMTLLRPLAKEAPDAASVRELYGLTLYRLERWREAVRELEAFAALTQSTEQHPVLADAYRAQRRWKEVDRVWEELRAASPSAALVAEGRIVMAGALADRERLGEALALLDGARWRVGRPRDHHLATAYVLADLLERSGEVPRAREVFAWVASAAPDFADVERRVRALS